ncbi:MAG: hypothetical protein LKI80_02790 [Sporolactobacillus sp.]|jgi:biotin operon repressor|nr:hypothetical protein [Sporolactobacillus sp.]
MGTSRQNIGYFTKTVADRLHISRDKIRRLTQALEKEGYVIRRNRHHQRIYFEADIQAVKQIAEQMKRGRTTEEAAKTITGKFPKPADDPDHAPAYIDWEEPEKTESGITLSAAQFRLMVEQVAAATAEKTADRVMQRVDLEMERRIERRDKELMSRLSEVRKAARKKKNLLTRLALRLRRGEQANG